MLSLQLDSLSSWKFDFGASKGGREVTRQDTKQNEARENKREKKRGGKNLLLGGTAVPSPPSGGDAFSSLLCGAAAFSSLLLGGAAFLPPSFSVVVKLLHLETKNKINKNQQEI